MYNECAMGRRGVRRRAVRLSDEALGLVQAALKERARSSGKARLTRPQRAALLGLSISTADRMLARTGNDQAVIEEAFAKLGIPWQESYAVWVEQEAPPQTEPEEVLASTPPATTDPPVAPAPRGQRRGWRLGVLVAAALVGVFALAGFMANKIAEGRLTSGEKARLDVARLISASRQANRSVRLDVALREARAAYQIAVRHGLADSMADSLRLQGDILAAQGRLPEAVECYEKALPLWKVLEADHGLACLFESLGIAEARLGRLDEAEHHLHEALKICRKLDDPGLSAGLMRGLGSIEAVRGNHAAAQRWYDAAGLHLKDRPSDAIHHDLRALQALLRRDKGEHDAALADLEQCLRYWQHSGQPRWIATTLLQIATVHAAAGRRAEADRLARDAQGLYESVGDRAGATMCADFVARQTPDPLAWRVEEFF